MVQNGLSSSGDKLRKKLTLALNSTGKTEKSLEKSRPGKTLEKRLAKAMDILKVGMEQHDPALALELEKQCILFEKDFFAHNPADHDRYDKQLSEVSAAKQSLLLTQDAEAYKRHVSEAYGPNRVVQFAPSGETYRTFIEKHNKQLGRDKNTMLGEKFKEFLATRQNSLKTGLTAYVELQCKSLGINAPAKSKDRNLGREKSL